MDTSQDALGHELYDHFVGKDVVEIIERDDGLIATSAGPSAYFSQFDEWPSYEKEALGYVRGRVLDIGCGAGRHSLFLQQRGHDVVGIDNSPLAIQVCRERGLRKAFVMPVTQVSRKLGIFDTIIMMGNNFGLMANRSRARWLLRRFHKITSGNGRIIGTSNDIYQTDEADHLAYHERNRQRGRMPGQVRIRVRYRRYKGPWFDYLMVSGEEMAELVQDTGWRIDHYIESEASQYAAILEKPIDESPANSWQADPSFGGV